MMSSWQYLIGIRMNLDMKKAGKRRGGHWCTSVADGGVLFLDHHVT
jgi:hypothetical protein